MPDLCWPGIEPRPLAARVRSLTTGPPGNSLALGLNHCFCDMGWVSGNSLRGLCIAAAGQVCLCWFLLSKEEPSITGSRKPSCGRDPARRGSGDFPTIMHTLSLLKPSCSLSRDLSLILPQRTAEYLLWGRLYSNILSVFKLFVFLLLNCSSFTRLNRIYDLQVFSPIL